MAKTDLSAALSQLDPENDAHWTSNGSPAVKAVEQIMNASTDRQAITDADPELTRDKARERAQAPAEPASNTTTQPASEAEQAAAADHRPEGQPDVQVTGEAVAKTLTDAATAAEATPEVETQATPADDSAPLDTTDVTGGGENRPAVGTGWDPGKRVVAQQADGPASQGDRPTVGTGFDAGPRVEPETADGPITAEQLIDQNPGPHVPPVQADGAIPESVDPTAFQPRAATSPALQDAPVSTEPTKEEIAQASDVDFEKATDEYDELTEEHTYLLEQREKLNRRIEEVQNRRDVLVLAREVQSDSHVDATQAYFARQDEEKANNARIREAQLAALGNMSPDVGGSQLDIAAAQARKPGHGQTRHVARGPIIS